MSLRRAYLDYNATAPLLPAARAAMLGALDLVGNASSVHAEGRAARSLVEEARAHVAALCAARPEHVVFTSGATEAAATLLSPRWRMGRAPLAVSRLYVCAADHPATLSGGRFEPGDCEAVGVDANGILDMTALSRLLDGHDRASGLPLVAFHAANNETGVVQPFAEIGRMAKAKGAVTVIDAVQAAGRVPLDISEGYADFLILSSHKLGGPQGAGAIVGNTDLMMPAPLLPGGGQEKGHRAGTENVASIAGFGAAARAASGALVSTDSVRARRDEIERIVRGVLPGAVIHGQGAERLCNTSFFSLPGIKAQTAQIAFDLEGVSLSAGSACSSGKVGPSHVLKAMGRDEGQGALRVSIGHGTNEDDIELFGAALARIAARSRAATANAA